MASGISSSTAGARIMMIAAICYGIHCLSLIQGAEGPLSFLKSPTVALTSILIALVLACLSRFLSPVTGFRWQVPWVGLMVLLLLIGEVSAEARPDQFVLLVMYLLPFLVAASVPHAYRSYLLLGVLIAAVVQCVVALMFGPYVPTLSGVPQLSGGLQPNILAIVAASVSILGVSRFSSLATIHHNVLSGLFVVLGAVVVILTVSRTGMLALLLGVAAAVVAKVQVRKLVGGLVAIAIFAMAYAALSLPLGPMEDWFVRGDEASISSLTGRTYIWDVAWQFFNARPLLGWGFGALYGSDSTAGEFLTLVRGTNTHNAWLQLLVETGVFVTVMAAALFLSLWIRSLRVNGADRPLIVGLVAAVSFNSLGSASFATLGFAACLVGALYLASRSPLASATSVSADDASRLAPSVHERTSK